MQEMKITEFAEVLASSAPIPGGGGAAAIVGALAVALGRMVANLTKGKKKYAAVEEEIVAAEARLSVLQKELLQFAQKDAEAFLPLSEAYKMPKGEERDRVMEEALYGASVVPVQMMELILESMRLLEILCEKGSRLALSDAGTGVVFAQAALEGASMNVWINTGMMKDREGARMLTERAKAILAEGEQIRRRTYPMVLEQL